MVKKIPITFLKLVLTMKGISKFDSQTILTIKSTINSDQI